MMRWRIAMAMVRRSDSDDAIVRNRYCDGAIALLQLCDSEDAMLYRVIVRFSHATDNILLHNALSTLLHLHT